jgi:hypothetical protein
MNFDLAQPRLGSCDYVVDYVITIGSRQAGGVLGVRDRVPGERGRGRQPPLAAAVQVLPLLGSIL